MVGRWYNPSQELSLSQFLLAGVGGALGGSLSWGLTRGMVHTSGDFVGRVLSKSLNGPSRAAWFGANITAGTLGGVVGDGLDQAYLLATGRQDGWNVGRSIFAGVQGAVALIPAIAAPSVSDLPEFPSGKQAGKRRPIFPSHARSKAAGRSGGRLLPPPTYSAR